MIWRFTTSIVLSLSFLLGQGEGLAFGEDIYPLEQQYVTDEGIDTFAGERRRESLVEWHRELVDRYNNLLNKIAFSAGVRPQQGVKSLELPRITIAETTPKGYIEDKVINVFEVCQARLSESFLLGRLKKRHLDPGQMDEIAKNLDEVRTWLDRAEVAYFGHKVAENSVLVVTQKAACMAEGRPDDGLPMSKKEVDAIEVDPILKCLNGQKIALNGMILTYDGLRHARSQDKAVRVKTSPASKSALPPKPAPRVASAAKAAPTPKASPAVHDKSLEKVDRGGLSSEKSEGSSKKNQKESKQKEGEPAAEDLLLTGSASSGDWNKDRIKDFKSDKKGKDAVSKRASAGAAGGMKINAYSKQAVEEYQKARREALKEREKKNEEALAKVFPKTNPLSPPPKPQKDSIESTPLDAKSEKALLSLKLRSKKELQSVANGILSDVLNRKKSSVDYGAFLIETEAIDSQFTDKDKVFGIALEKYLRMKQKYKALAESIKGLPYKEKVLKIAKEMNKDLLSEYTLQNARILDFMLGRGGNCDAESRLVMSILHETGLMDGDPDHIFGVQLFSDHVQPVIYDKKADTVLNLVANQAVQGVVAPIARPEIYFHSYSVMQGGATPVKNAQDLVLVDANPVLVKKALEQQKGQGAEFTTNTNILLSGVSSNVAYASGDGPLPEHATIVFNDQNASPKEFSSDLLGESYVPGSGDAMSNAASDSAFQSIPLMDKANTDLAEALHDPEFQEFMSTISSPASLKGKNLSPEKVKKMKEAFAKINTILSLDGNYFLGRTPPADIGEQIKKFIKGQDAVTTSYLLNVLRKTGDFLSNFRTYPMRLGGPLYEKLGAKEWPSFESLFDVESTMDMMTLSDGLMRSAFPGAIYHSGTVKQNIVPRNIAGDFADFEKTSFEAKFAKTKKQEKRGASIGKEKAVNAGKEANPAIDPFADQAGPTPKHEAGDAQKAVSGTKEATRNQRFVQGYGASEAGTKQKPEDAAGSYPTKLSAETFADYIRTFASGRNHFGSTLELVVEEGQFRTAILSRWTPLLSEELRLNDEEESLELMKWFVEKGADEIQQTRRADSSVPTTKHPIRDLDKISQDLARLYIHYYQKLASLGVQTSARLTVEQVDLYQKLVEEYDR